MEPISLGIKPLFDSWYQKLPESISTKNSLMIILKKLCDGNHFIF